MTEKEFILTKILDCDRVDLYVDPKILTAEQKVKFEAMQERRRQGEPLQYLLGECEFMGLKFKVDARVLIPRPETELLVESILEKVRQLDFKRTILILDLGTGSGNISVSLAKFLDCHVTTVDICAGAVAIAQENAVLNNVAHKVRFVHEDMKDFLKQARERGIQFDLIVSNPPYVETDRLDSLPADVQHEPRIALNGGQDGLDFYRLIITQAPALLNPSGFLFLEIGDGQARPLEKICSEYFPFAKIEFQRDYCDTNRTMIITNTNFQVPRKSQ